MNALPAIAFLGNIKGPELIIVFLIILVLFGAKRLPELFRSFGKSLNEFKKGMSEVENDFNTTMEAEEEKKKRSDEQPRGSRETADMDGSDESSTRATSAANDSASPQTASEEEPRREPQNTAS